MAAPPRIHARHARETVIDESAEGEPVIEFDEGLIEIFLGRFRGQDRKCARVRLVEPSCHRSCSLRSSHCLFLNGEIEQIIGTVELHAGRGPSPRQRLTFDFRLPGKTESVNCRRRRRKYPAPSDRLQHHQRAVLGKRVVYDDLVRADLAGIAGRVCGKPVVSNHPREQAHPSCAAGSIHSVGPLTSDTSSLLGYRQDRFSTRLAIWTHETGGAGVPRRAQQSNTDQQMLFRKRWSSRTSSRIASRSWSRCHWHSRRPAASPSPSGAAARAALIA